MRVYLGADHRGFRLKNHLAQFVQKLGHEVIDCGNSTYDEKDDYADFAVRVGEAVSRDPEGSRGVVLCGSGVGVDVTANKFKGVRAAIGFSSAQVHDARRDDDMNVLALAAGFTSEAEAEEIVQSFLNTQFSHEERHVRRLRKISDIEHAG
jgi:ribose 5-phosphate isomerase B